jgi:hypothetical protein
MIRICVILALLLAAACAGCDSSVTPQASQLAAVQPSVGTSAAPSSSPSPSPSASPSPTPTATPDPTATPTATPPPPPPPWKTYISKLFHYSIKYPPDWVVTHGSSRLADQFDAYGYPYVYVDRDVVSGSASVSLTVTHDIAHYKSHYHAKLISNKSIRLAGGYVGRILVFTGTDQGLKATFQHIIVAKGKVGYFIDMVSDFSQTAADKVLFKKIYTTWRPR